MTPSGSGSSRDSTRRCSATSPTSFGRPRDPGMPEPRDGPDAVIRDDLDRVVRDGRLDLTPLSGANVLLTGGTGFVGRFLVETLLRSNEVGGGAPCVVTLPTRRPGLVRDR